jgi:hypothetical protein
LINPLQLSLHGDFLRLILQGQLNNTQQHKSIGCFRDEYCCFKKPIFGQSAKYFFHAETASSVHLNALSKQPSYPAK